MDKKPADRGVADSIAALRHQRYMTRGLGRFEKGGRGKRESADKPSVDELRKNVAKVKPTKKKRKAKRGRR